jgi:hypothetical protein
MLKVDTNKQTAPRIGPAYQADLPPPLLNSSGAAAGDECCSGGETLMWSPQWELPEEQLDTYLRLCASSAAAAGGGLAAEEALRILTMCRGNVFQVEWNSLYVVNAVTGTVIILILTNLIKYLEVLFHLPICIRIRIEQKCWIRTVSTTVIDTNSEMITFCKNSDPKISKFSLLWFLKPRIYSSN